MRFGDRKQQVRSGYLGYAVCSPAVRLEISVSSLAHFKSLKQSQIDGLEVLSSKVENHQQQNHAGNSILLRYSPLTQLCAFQLIFEADR